MATRYFINADGTVFGGIGSSLETRLIPDPDFQGDDGESAPLIGQTYETWPAVSADLIELDEPPEHGADVLRGFSVTDGHAVGGTWDTSGRPQPAPSEGQRVIAALVAAGVITQKQGDATLSSLN